MIKLKELELTNFRSWKHLHLTDFDKKGLCLIRGKNGSGKSSIRMAIEYLILDKTSDELSVKDIPRNSNKSCSIIGKFEVDGKPLTITKYRNHKKFTNKTIVNYDGDTSLTANDRRITQKNIESIFKVTPDILFTSTIFTINSPSFIESLEADRKKLLYSILPLDVYSELYLAATGKSKLIKAKITKQHYSIEFNEEALTDLKKETIELIRKEERYEDEIEDKLAGLRQARDEFTIQSTVDIEDKIADLEKELKEVSPSQQDIDAMHSKEVDLATLERKYSDLSYDRKYIRSKLSDLSDGTCPILNINCDMLQKDAAKTIEKYEPDLEEVEKSLLDTDIKITNLKLEIREFKKSVESIRHLENKIRDFLAVKLKIESENREIDLHLKAINSKIEELKSDSSNPFTLLVRENKNKTKDLLLTLNKTRKSIKELEQELEYYLYFEKAFSKAGIPNMKSDGFLSSIETETNRYLSAVSDRMYVEISSQTEVGNELREKIEYKVLHPDKVISSYSSYSGGERQRVKVSDLFAFNSLISNFGFMFLDEVLEGSIDTKGKMDILSLLKLKAKEVDSLLVVSHDDTIKDAFDNVIEVVSKNGVSILRGNND